MMTDNRLHHLLSSFPTRRIIVVGDYFLDKYLECDPRLAEVSLETGKTAHQVVNVRHSPGAGGAVVSNLVSLGAGEVIPVGFTGDDGEGYDLRKDIAALGCSTDYLQCVSERRTPTYLKPRDIAIPGLDGEAERYDTKNREPLPEHVERGVVASLDELLPRADAVIIADQVEEDRCGAITCSVREQIARMAGDFPNVIFWADSRRRIGLFRNVIIKPNQREAVRAAFPGSESPLTDEMVVKAGHELRLRTGKPVFITRSERGILVFDEAGCTEIPGVRVERPIDPTGAGDSATAAAVLTLCSGGTSAEAALLANLVASITIQQLSVTGTAKPEDLPARLGMWASSFSLEGEG